MKVAQYRGQRTDTKEWIYGSLLIDFDGTCTIIYWVSKLLEPENNYKEPVQEGYNVIPETIGQYIGLRDCLTNQMYEGDIVNIGQTVNGQSNFIIYACLPKMDIRYAMDMDKLYEYDGYDMLLAEDISVIGNIHDNTELFNKP